MSPRPPNRRQVFTPPRSGRSGFTLIEILVVVAITGVLVSVLVPALSSAHATVRMLECSSNMRTVTIEFGLFVDGRSAGGRGDSETLGGDRFWINDFQDSLYDTDEFWDLGVQARGPVGGDGKVMLCPAAPSDLVKRRGFPCGTEAVGPTENISLAMNMRLYRGVVEFRGRRVLAPVSSTHVPSRIVNHPNVPLMIDVDGSRAVEQGVEPFYIAPAVRGRNDPYASERYWAPSSRHHGKANIAFVGGHVLSSEKPEQERWDWGFEADVGR